MIKKVLIIVTIIAIFSSCESKYKKMLVGSWTIDNIYYQDDDILYYIYSNMIFFKKDNSCILPRTDFYPSKNGTWELSRIDTSYYLTFDADSNLLHGKFQAEIYKDYKNKLLKLRLSSDSLSLTCSKLMHIFEP